jgi:hypothetical protein
MFSWKNSRESSASSLIGSEDCFARPGYRSTSKTRVQNSQVHEAYAPLLNGPWWPITFRWKERVLKAESGLVKSARRKLHEVSWVIYFDALYGKVLTNLETRICYI